MKTPRTGLAPQPKEKQTPAGKTRTLPVFLERSTVLYPLLSLLILIPCFWHARLQAGDLSSHIYNAWLAQLIETGKGQGLLLASQTTNILFDLMLSASLKAWGPQVAQRICVAIAVLVFVWGAFAFVAAAGGRRNRELLPAIVMLAYGWVYHIGFFNFYLGLGLCFCALALAWEGGTGRRVAAVVLLALAYLAHALPVAWAVAVFAYSLTAKRLDPRHRNYLALGCLLALIPAHVLIRSLFGVEWSLGQYRVTTGADQLWIYDEKYTVIAAALLLIWAIAAIRLVRSKGLAESFAGIPFQLAVLSGAGILLFPNLILIPGYALPVIYVADRMSLAVGICFLAALAPLPVPRYQRYALLLVAAAYFGLLYRDEGIFSAFEQRMERLVATLPPGLRVVNAVEYPSLRINALHHMIDRICVGRCYSYTNYEPSSTQFRVRAITRNPIVRSMEDAAISRQRGGYFISQHDDPVYQVNMDQTGQLVIQQLKAGATFSETKVKLL